MPPMTTLGFEFDPGSGLVQVIRDDQDSRGGYLMNHSHSSCTDDTVIASAAITLVSAIDQVVIISTTSSEQ